MGLLLEEVFQRPGGRSPQNFTAFQSFTVEYTRLSAQDCAALEFRVLAHPHLTTDNRLLADRAASRNSGLCRDYGVFSYFHVVSDLYQIVEFHSLANDGG